jgi:3-(3-hydroxy-phenyl)propionate hydroxylase
MPREPILIVGAGPAGLVTALGLARNGVPVVVLETGAELPQDLRATTFHPPTLDMLGTLGVVDSLIAKGNVAPTWQFRDRREGQIAEFDLALIADVTKHPYRLQCEQFYLTELLKDALLALSGSKIMFDAHATGVSQDADGVTVTVDSPSGKNELRGSILVGADGGRSAVRKSLPIDFEGFTYEERIIQVGTPFDFRAALPDIAEINYIADPDEWCVLLRVSGYWRVSFPIGQSQDEAAELTPEAFQRRLQALSKIDGEFPLMQRKCWRVHQRVASNFRHGRAVLVGDAAHVNSPHGGMGMNSAVHDAVNLSEKLTRIWAGEAPLDLLDHYTRQRRYVATEDVKAQSMRNSQLIKERDPGARRERHDAMRRLARDADRSREFLLASSMIQGLNASTALP